MIPRTIHYIWLGKGKMNTAAMMCVNSWHRILNNYEIKLWDEESLELNRLAQNNRFLNECLKRKLWAFASDYLRLYVLYNEGGIYLDTDVEVVKSFDTFLDNEMFIGFEEGEYIGTGVIGAEKGNNTIKSLLEFYENDIWNVEFFTNPVIFRYLYDNNKEIFDGCKIYTKDYFSPYNYLESNTELVDSENTVCIHWYSGNWGLSRKGSVFLNTKHIKNPVVKAFMMIRKSLGYYKYIWFDKK